MATTLDNERFAVDSASPVAPPRWLRHSAVLAAAIVLLVGLTALPVPFMGDQALYTLGGQALTHGKTLYTQFWDVKQPGVFVFYATGGTLFGYSEVGIHLLELVWQLALAVLVVRAVRGRLAHPWLEPLAAVLTVGSYYAVAAAQELTQVEALVGLPILATVLLFKRAVDGDRRLGNGALAGVALFVVASLKLLLIGVPIACCAVVLYDHVRVHRRSVDSDVLRRFAYGFFIPMLVFLGWMTAHGALAETARTWFVEPLGVPHRAGRSAHALAFSAKLFLKTFLPLLLLGAVGAWRALSRRGDVLARCMVAWIVAGTVAFLMQMWWFYQTMLFVVPLGVLAIYGFDTLLQRWRDASRVATVLAIVTLIASGGFTAERFARRALHLTEHGAALGRDDAQQFHYAEWPSYETIDTAARELSARSPHDTVVVWGDPLYLYLAHRSQAIAVNGWAAEQIDEHLWERAAQEFHQARPTLVFVNRTSARYLLTRGRRFNAELQRDYVETRSTADGTWYERRAAA